MNNTIQLALALAMGASSVAHATTGTASINFTNLNIATIDLNPNDTLAASYEVLTGGAPTTVTASTYEAVTQSAPGIFTPLSATSTDPASGSSAQATVGASGFAASANGSGARARVGSSDDPVGTLSPNIRLAPWTGILITGNYQIVLTTDCQEVSYRCRSSVELRADIPGTTWNTSFDDISPNGEYGRSTEFYQYFATEASGTQTFTGSAGTSYWNFSGHAQDITLRFTAEAAVATSTVAASITSVPEPTSLALLVAGLVSAAAVGQRQRSQGSTQA